MSLDSMGTPSQSTGGSGGGGGGGGSGGTTIGNRMTHSLSTPSGVDGSSAPVNRGGKKLAIRIQMLDDSVTLFQVQVRIFLINRSESDASKSVQSSFIYKLKIICLQTVYTRSLI